MSLMIGKYLFTGPFEVEKCLVRKNQAAVVFTIVCRGGEPWNPTFTAIAFGESGEEGIVFADHPDRVLWEANSDGELGIYLLTEIELETRGSRSRQAVVAELETAYPPGNAGIPISGGH